MGGTGGKPRSDGQRLRLHQMTFIGADFTTTCHTKQLNPWRIANLSASHVVIHSQLSAWQGKMASLRNHPISRGSQTGLRKRPE